MRTQWDIVIIGAGPAGMSAALQATRHGLSGLVLDRQAEPGGQIFRSAGSASADKRKQIGCLLYTSGRLLTSSRNSVPPLASSIFPIMPPFLAPVNAPPT